MSSCTVMLAALVLTGCSVGEVDIGSNNNTRPDAGRDSGTDVSPRDTCANRGTPGIAHVHGTAPANTRAGLGCKGSGCHGAANPASSVFAFAGTVYKEPGGTTPNPGAVVRIFKEGPVGTFTLVTTGVSDDGGNFQISGNYTDFPYVTDVTACGADAPVQGIRPMQGLITAGNTDCNGGGACHAVPGTLAMYLAD